MIISAIFRELYRPAKQINTDTIDDFMQTGNILLSQSTTIIAPQSVEINPNPNSNSNSSHNLNLINNIPETILSRIATYLTTKELFFNRNNVCKQLFRIGMKPESIQHWCMPKYYNSDESDLTQKNTKIISHHNCKFDIYPLLSQLKRITFDNHNNFLPKFAQQSSSVGEWHQIDINAKVLGDCDELPWDNISNIRELTIRNSMGIASDLAKVKQCVCIHRATTAGGGLKRLSIVDSYVAVTRTGQFDDIMLVKGVEGQKEEIITNETEILEMLQVLMPLTKQKHEEIASRILQEKIKLFKNKYQLQTFVFGDRLPNDKSPAFVTSYLTDTETETIKNNVIKEIESKYDTCTFDETELSYPTAENNNTVEMLEFCGCVAHIDSEAQSAIWDNYLNNSHSRVINGLPNLKSLAFCEYNCLPGSGNDHDFYDWDDNFFSMITRLILNLIGHKLTSLHLCDCCNVWHHSYFWKKIKLYKSEQFDEKHAKKYESEPWYLKNVSELCLKIQHSDWYLLVEAISSVVNVHTLPSLTRLKIVCFGMDDTYKSPLAFDNHNNYGARLGLISLVNQQLESLDLCFKQCTLHDFFQVQQIRLRQTIISQSNRLGMYLNTLQLYFKLKDKSLSCSKRKFILKLHFVIKIDHDVPEQDTSDTTDCEWNIFSLENVIHENILDSMSNEMSQLCQLICQSFENVIFGLKITFYGNENWYFLKKEILPSLIVLCDNVGDDPFFKSSQCDSVANATYIESSQALTSTLVSQASVKEYSFNQETKIDREIVFAMILNKCGKDINNDINGYCEPRFEYPCNYCRTEPWFGSQLTDQYGCKTTTYREYP